MNNQEEAERIPEVELNTELGQDQELVPRRTVDMSRIVDQSIGPN